MTRLAALLSGCSAFLVASWLLVGSYDQKRVQRPRGGRKYPATAEIPKQSLGRNRLGERKAPPVKLNSVTKGVVINKKKLLDSVTLEDLQAPSGRLWIPAALSGSVNKNSPNPLLNVMVAFCQVNFYELLLITKLLSIAIVSKLVR